MTITITPDGTMQFVYDDALAPMLDLGEHKIVRASNVEPGPGGWTADMLDGVILGPFALRGDALAAEVELLERRLAGE